MSISGSYTSLLATPLESSSNRSRNQARSCCLALSSICQSTLNNSVNRPDTDRPVLMESRKALRKYYIKPSPEEFTSLEQFMEYAQNNSASSLRINVNKWLNRNPLFERLCRCTGDGSSNQQLKEQLYSLLLDRCKKVLSDCHIKTAAEDNNEYATPISNAFNFLKIDQSTPAPLSLEKAKCAANLSIINTLTCIHCLRDDTYYTQLKCSMQKLDLLTIRVEPLLLQSGNDDLINLLSKAKQGVSESSRQYMFEDVIFSVLKTVFENNDKDPLILDEVFKIPRDLELLKQSTSNVRYISSLEKTAIQYIDNLIEKTDSLSDDMINTLPVLVLKDLLPEPRIVDNKESDLSSYYRAGLDTVVQLEKHESDLRESVDPLLSALLAAVNETTSGNLVKLWWAVEKFSPCFCIKMKDYHAELHINPTFFEHQPATVLDIINSILSQLDTKNDWLCSIKRTCNSAKEELGEYEFNWNSQDKKITFSRRCSIRNRVIQNNINSAKKRFIANLAVIKNSLGSNPRLSLSEYKNKVEDELLKLIDSKHSRLTIRSAYSPTESTYAYIPEHMDTAAPDNETTSFVKQLRGGAKKKSKQIAQKASKGIKQFSTQIQGHGSQLAHANDDFRKIEAVHAQIDKIKSASTNQEVHTYIQELIDRDLFKNEERKDRLQDLLNPDNLGIVPL